MRLQRARAGGLLPGEEEALTAQEALDAKLAETPAPNEPSIPKSQPIQPLAQGPANRNAPAASPPDVPA